MTTLQEQLAELLLHITVQISFAMFTPAEHLGYRTMNKLNWA
jgi:hypothetical protein